MIKLMLCLLVLFFSIAGSATSIPIIDVLVQGHETPPSHPLLRQPEMYNQIEPATQARFTLHSLISQSARHHWVRPLRMTFSIDSLGIYHRNRLLRSCFKPFSESSLEILPSYGLQRIQEFSPVFSLAQEPSQIPILVSSVSITLALPE